MIVRKYLKFFILLLLFQCVFSAEPIKTTPIIIDTDMATDDVIALTYLLRDPSLDIKAIILDDNASTDCQYGYPHLASIIALTNHHPINIACGATKALGEGHRFPNWLRNKLNLMPGVEFSEALHEPLKHDGVSLLIDILNKAKQPITILSIGSLTNIALALQQDPVIKSKISKIYMMGGAINVAGNIKPVDATSQNTIAEWNIYFDPVAANFVFQSHVPIYLIPLDATLQVPITPSFYKMLANVKKTTIGELNFQVLTLNKSYIQKNLIFFWDPLAAFAMNHPICDFKPIRLTITLKPENLVGATRIKATGNLVFVCTAPNTKLFMQLIENRIN